MADEYDRSCFLLHFGCQEGSFWGIGETYRVRRPCLIQLFQKAPREVPCRVNGRGPQPRVVSVAHRPAIREVLAQVMAQPHGAEIISSSPRSVRMTVEAAYGNDAIGKSARGPHEMGRIQPTPLRLALRSRKVA